MQSGFQKLLAILQIALGLFGIGLCIFLYQTYCASIQDALTDVDALAGDVNVQAEIGDELLEEWGGILRNFDSALVTYERSLAAASRSSAQVEQTIQQWNQGLNGFSQVTRDAERITLKFARQLPIKVPNLDVKTRQLEIAIPNFELQTDTIKIPYPTARVGSRKVTLDVGLTDLKFDVPTLNVGTLNKTVTVPVSPNVTTKTERISVPDDVKVVYREFFSDEKALLEETASQLNQTTTLLSEANETVNEIQAILSNEVQASLAVTADNLRETQSALQETYSMQIPELRNRLSNQQGQLERSQLNTRKMRSMVPWLFLLASLLPAAITLQGTLSWLRVSSRSRPQVAPEPIL